MVEPESGRTHSRNPEPSGAAEARGWSGLGSLVLALVGGLTSSALAAAPAFEAPPVLSAPELAPAELLQGPQFKVDREVPTDGLLATFTIRSDFGVFTAQGPGMLATRVGEVHALQVLKETEKSEVFGKALAASAKRTGKSIATAVANPVETVKALPEGVGRFFERVGRSVKTGAQKAEDYLAASKASESTKSGDQVAADVGRAAGDAGSNVIGQEDSRRRVAKALEVDPYTTNPELTKKLNEFAWVVFAGEFGLDAGLAIVPGGMAIKVTRTWVSDLVYDLTPGDLDVRAQKQLAELGVKPEVTDRLLRQKHFTRTTRTSLLEALAALGPGPDRTDVIPWAVTAESEVQARFMAGATGLLAQHHKAASPITKVRVAGTLIGQTAAGGLVVPAPVDYVVWTQRVARFVERPDLAAPDRQILVTGRVSPRARQELERRRWTVREGFEGGLVGPGGPAALEGTPRNPKP